ncbi:hypothetical protein HY486_03820 [Candidatus Woesearchaeota archaeon]|nr:hypothetical protein [Candidatus Woesearchaeota archaeon]
MTTNNLRLEDIDIGIGESGVSVFAVIPLGGKRSLDEDRTFRRCNSHCKCNPICKDHGTCDCNSKKEKGCYCVSDTCSDYCSEVCACICTRHCCPDYR